jgi:GNAT superfamily N-acetyltransferase
VDPTTDVRIRRISASDAMVLRDLRLRSITDAPEAFGQPLDEAQGRSVAEWQRSARQSAQGDHRSWLIAETDERTVGLVQGRRRRPSTLLLFSMWVDPSARRLGIGRGLIEALEAWARGWDANETILWVHSGNAAAIDFYRDLGFEHVRRGQDAESGARFGAMAMRRAIHSPA